MNKNNGRLNECNFSIWGQCFCHIIDVHSAKTWIETVWQWRQLITIAINIHIYIHSSFTRSAGGEQGAKTLHCSVTITHAFHNRFLWIWRSHSQLFRCSQAHTAPTCERIIANKWKKKPQTHSHTWNNCRSGCLRSIAQFTDIRTATGHACTQRKATVQWQWWYAHRTCGERI